MLLDMWLNHKLLFSSQFWNLWMSESYSFFFNERKSIICILQSLRLPKTHMKIVFVYWIWCQSFKVEVRSFLLQNCKESICTMVFKNISDEIFYWSQWQGWVPWENKWAAFMRLLVIKDLAVSFADSCKCSPDSWPVIFTGERLDHG